MESHGAAISDAYERRAFRAPVPPELKPRIFEKFAQADGQSTNAKTGTGLGLSIVKQVVARLGGEVGFTDAPGGGTILYVDLLACERSGGHEARLARILYVGSDRASDDQIVHALDGAAEVVRVGSREEARHASSSIAFDSR